MSETESGIEVCQAKDQQREVLQFDLVLNSRGASKHMEQEELFEFIRPAVLSCFEGISCTLVAHGGPRSGKTYTLSGFLTQGQLHGLAPRAIQVIFGVMESSPTTVPAIELSFFEMHQDRVCDLLKSSYPPVSISESSQPPYAALGPNLTACRCDSAAGFHRLLDAYFVGLERHRQGWHTCFQMAFLRADGQPQTYLRFVEMAWQGPQGSSQLPDGAMIAVDEAAAALEQVIKCALSSSNAALSASAYQSSALALLLKPCIEGKSLMYFIHCMRLDQEQFPCLLASAPLLSKIHQLISAYRAMPRGRRSSMNALGQRARPIVPPLKLGCSCIRDAACIGQPLDGCLSTASSSGASSTRTSPELEAGDCGVCAGRPPAGGTGDNPGAGPAVVSTRTAAAAADELSGVVMQPEGVADEHLASEDALQEMWVMRHCSKLLAAKLFCVEALEAEAACCAAVLHSLCAAIGRLRGQRKASHSGGASERETNMRRAYERVHHSFQRSAQEIRRMRKDIETLNEFCSSIALAVQASASHSANERSDGMEARSNATGQPIAELPSSTTPLRETVVVPQLPLALLRSTHSTVDSACPGLVSPSSATSSRASTSAHQPETSGCAFIQQPHPILPVSADSAALAVPGIPLTAAAMNSVAGLAPRPPAPSLLAVPEVASAAWAGAAQQGGPQLQVPQQWSWLHSTRASPPPLSRMGEAEQAGDATLRGATLHCTANPGHRGDGLNNLMDIRPRVAQSRSVTPLRCADAAQCGAGGGRERLVQVEVEAPDESADNHSVCRLRTTASQVSLGQHAAPVVMQGARTPRASRPSPMPGQCLHMAGAGVAPEGSAVAQGHSSSPPLPLRRPLGAQAGLASACVASSSRLSGARATTPAARHGRSPTPQGHSPMTLGRNVPTPVLYPERGAGAPKPQTTTGPQKPCLSPERRDLADRACVAAVPSPMRTTWGRNRGRSSTPARAPVFQVCAPMVPPSASGIGAFPRGSLTPPHAGQGTAH